MLRHPIRGIRDSIDYLKLTPLESIGRLMLYLILLTSIVLILLSLILFIVGGGIAEQFGAIRSCDFGASFTTGRTDVYFNQYTTTACGLLFGLSFVLIYINFIRQNDGAKRIWMIALSSIILLVVAIVPLYLYLVISGTFPIPSIIIDSIMIGATPDMEGYEYVRELLIEEVRAEPFRIVLFMASVYTQTIVILLAIYVILLLGSLIASFIMIAKRGDRELLGMWFLTALLYLAVAPLLLLILHNIIPFAALALIIGIVILVLKFFGGSESGASSGTTGSSAGFASSGSSSGYRSESSAYTHGNSSVSSNASDSNAYKPKNLDTVKPHFFTYDGTQVFVIANNYTVFEDENFHGYKYMRMKGGATVDNEICSVADLKSGKMIIERGNIQDVMQKYKSMGK